MLPVRFAGSFKYSFTWEDANFITFSILWKFNLVNVEFLISCSVSPVRIIRKFSSNDKLRKSMSPNISLGLCPLLLKLQVSLIRHIIFQRKHYYAFKYCPHIPCKIVFWQRWVHIVAPFMYRQITGCFPTLISSISTKDDSILWIVFKTQQLKLRI